MKKYPYFTLFTILFALLLPVIWHKLFWEEITSLASQSSADIVQVEEDILSETEDELPAEEDI